MDCKSIFKSLDHKTYAETDYGIILNEDCLIGVKEIESKSVQLVVTSPPYADRRKKTYGGIKEEDYIEWFKPIAVELYRVLADNGSFVMNIKEHTVDGHRSLYVLDLVLMLCREVGFQLIDTFAWTKNGFPGKYTNRFKNAWEPVYHFAKQSEIAFYPDHVATAVTEVSKKRVNRKFSGQTQNGSGFHNSNTEHMKKREIAHPSNHLAIPNAMNQYSDNKWHPAVFPVGLPEFFIRALTKEGDITLDPFSGSARSAIAAIRNNRKYIGFELNEEFFTRSHNSIEVNTGLKPVVNQLPFPC